MKGVSLMSRQADERLSGRNGKNRSTVASSGVKFVQYRPNKAEKEEMDKRKWTVEAAFSRLAALTERGAKITLGFRAENSAYFVHLRNEEDAFGEGVIISVFHLEAETALIALAHAMDTRFKEWPDVQLSFPEENNW
jgi:hypothetical protein